MPPASPSPPPRRLPRRMPRALALFADIDNLLAARLDRIDRRAPLPTTTIAAVNALLTAGAAVLARAPADRITALAPGAMPADALIALLMLQAALEANYPDADLRIAPREADAAPEADLPPWD